MPHLWAEVAGNRAPTAFREQVRQHQADIDPVKLLRQSNSSNNAAAERQAADWIGPINCLEWLVFEHQNGRIPVLERPTEFAAFVLRSPDGAKLKIIYYTRNEDGIGRIGQAASQEVDDSRAEGWQVRALLHPHNFHPGQLTLNGMLAPSGPDTQLLKALAKNLGLEEAWITNGLDTLRINASALELFSEI